MKVGDIVKHKYGTMQGFGVVLDMPEGKRCIRALWTSHGRTVLHETVASRFLEVVNAASR